MNAKRLGLAMLVMASCGRPDTRTQPAEGSARSSRSSRSSARDGRLPVAAARPPTAPTAPPSASEEPDRPAALELPPHLAAPDSPFRAPRPSDPPAAVDPLEDSRWRLVLERSDATAPRIWINASGRSATNEAIQLSSCTASRYLRGELLGRSGSCSVSVLLPAHVGPLASALKPRMAKAFVADRVCVSAYGRDECADIAEWQQADDSLIDRVFVAIASEE